MTLVWWLGIPPSNDLHLDTCVIVTMESWLHCYMLWFDILVLLDQNESKSMQNGLGVLYMGILKRCYINAWNEWINEWEDQTCIFSNRSSSSPSVPEREYIRCIEIAFCWQTATRGHPFMTSTRRGRGQAPCGRPHRKFKLESTEVILSSPHAKKLSSFLPEFRR